MPLTNDGQGHRFVADTPVRFFAPDTRHSVTLDCREREAPTGRCHAHALNDRRKAWGSPRDNWRAHSVTQSSQPNLTARSETMCATVARQEHRLVRRDSARGRYGPESDVRSSFGKWSAAFRHDQGERNGEFPPFVVNSSRSW
jgi:hypothetical protein